MIALMAVAATVAGPAAATEQGFAQGYPDPTPDQVAERRSDLREARGTWRRRRLRNYRYRIERACFCSPQFRGPVRITVREGRPRRTPKPFRDVDTVRELFVTVEELISAHELSARYDARGVPRRIEADPVEGLADEEVAYLVSRFHRLPHRSR